MRLGLLLLALLPAAPALAEGTLEDKEAAKAHYLAGSAYYEGAQYADALREFTEAYRLASRPDLLYNISLCHERLDQLDQAIDALKRYLAEKPDADDRGRIQARIETLEKRRKPPAPAAPAPAPAPPPPVAPAITKPSPLHGHVASVATMAAGAAVLVVSLGTGLGAHQLHGELEPHCPGGLCDPSFEARANQARALAITSDVTLGVGAAVVATGLVLLIVELKRPAHKAAAARYAWGTF